MISAESFVSLLEEKDLLAPEVLLSIRQQLRESTQPLDADAIAHLLIRQGHLTASLAERLLAGQTGKPESAAPQIKPTSTKGAKPKAPAPPAHSPTSPLGGKIVPPRSQLSDLLNEELPPLTPQGSAPLDALMAADIPTFSAGPRKPTLRQLLRNVIRRMRGQSVEVEAADPRQVKMVLWTWGGAVTLLVLVFGVFWYLSPPAVDEMLRRAADSYEAGNYTESVQGYESYLHEYAYLPRASFARVRRALAELHQAAQEAKPTGEWSPAFEVAQKLMRTLPSEAAFEESDDEVGVALASIGEGLAAQACRHSDPKIADQVRMIVGLIEMNIPEKSRPSEMLLDINRKLRQSEQRAVCERELTETLTALHQTLAKGDAAAACAIRNAAVKRYPELGEDPRLEQALTPALGMLQAAVKMVEQKRPALTAQRPSGVLASVTLAQRTVQGEVPEAGGRLIFAGAEGAAYALDAATGKLLWRRFVTLPKDDQRPAMPPLPLSQEPGSDVLLTDSVNHELLRVEGATGRLLWRHALEQPIVAEPVRVGNRLLVPTENGRLVIVDLLTGVSPGRMQLPQPMHLPPTVDTQRILLYQVADSSNLFVLSSGDAQCRQVFHLGHESGTIVAPPVIADNLLLVAVNDSRNESTLNVLSLGPAGAGQGGAPLKLVQQVRVKGHIKTPPIIRPHRLLIVTAQGGLQLFEFDPARAGTPLKSIARNEVSGEEQRLRYPLVRGNRCWVADVQLARYEIPAAGGRLVPRKITDRGYSFLQPIVTIGPALYHVRQKPGMPGVTVSAVDLESHEPYWQTWIAAPLAHEPMVDAAAQKLTAVTTLGGMFSGEASAFRGRSVADEPLLAIEATKLLQPVHEVTPLTHGMFAMTNGPGSQQIILYDPQVAEKEKRYRWLWVPVAMACSPLALDDGILAPCRDGQVFLLDPKSAGNMADPFQPSFKSATAWKWGQPDTAGPHEAVLSDGDKRIYLFHLKKEAAGMRLEAEETLFAKPIVSRVGVTGNVAYMIDSGGAAVAFELPKLTPGKVQPLGGLCVWGPQRVGKYVLLATDKDRLFCFDDRQQLLWEQAMPQGPLAGTPLADGDHYLLAARSGVICRVAAATGEQLAKTDVGCPLGTGPVLLGQRLFVGGHDGSFYEVKRP